MSLFPTTKLEAINVLLGSIGEAPVQSETSGLDEASIASTVLDEVSRTVQVLGWSWNTEDHFPLPLSEGNLITLPINTLKADFQTPCIIARGIKAYDRKNHTYQFKAPITATLILGLYWDELPESMRSYITYAAGRIFQARQVGSQILHEFNAIDEQRAWASLISAEHEIANLSIFDNAELSLMNNRSASSPVFDYHAGAIGGLIT